MLFSTFFGCQNGRQIEKSFDVKVNITYKLTPNNEGNSIVLFFSLVTYVVLLQNFHSRDLVVV